MLYNSVTPYSTENLTRTHTLMLITNIHSSTNAQTDTRTNSCRLSCSQCLLVGDVLGAVDQSQDDISQCRQGEAEPGTSLPTFAQHFDAASQVNEV